MQDFNKSVYLLLTKAEADGTLGASSTGNQILELAKQAYTQSDSAGKEAVLQKLLNLQREPGVKFPTNYLELLESSDKG